MIFRLTGMIITFLLVAYMIYSFFGTSNQAKKAMDANPMVKEQQQTLKDATGIDATDRKALKQYSIDQAKQIQDYQNQLQLPPQQ